MMECKNCKYKDWDCKNCYILDEEDHKENSFFPSLIFTIVLTRSCNLRCNYCGINFTEDSIGYDIIDNFINKVLNKRKNVDNIKFEFFGGEPLLEFNKIKYIVESTFKYDIKYSIVTNGFLLTEEIIYFLNKYKFEIVFSVALHSKNLLIEKKELFRSSNLSGFIINFIIEPGKEKFMYEIFLYLISVGFRKITILPVYYTKVWSDENFKSLNILLKKVSNFYFKFLNLDSKIELFYIRTTNDEVKFNITKTDVELFLDFDGKIYGDYDTELRLLKDYVNRKVFDINEIYLGNIGDGFNLLEIIKNRIKIKTIFYINKITNFYKIDKNLEKLGKIININNVNLLK